MARAKRKSSQQMSVATIKDLSDDALFCHAFRHGWDEYTPLADEFARPEFGTRVAQICNCGKKRIALFSRMTGENLSGWSYVDSAGYKVDEPCTLDDYRKEYFRRQRALRAVK